MPDTPEAAAADTLLSFDYGRRRIGIAVGQRITGSASPVSVARNGPNGPDWDHIGHCIAEWKPGCLLLGMPLHADGSDSEMQREVLEFAGQLAQYGIPIEHVDERYSSLEASETLRIQRAAGRRRVRKEHIDAAAAVIIAERWLSGETRPKR